MRFLDGDKDISGWKPEPNSIEGGNAYAQYIKDAFNTGYIIGSFWCNPVDSPKGFGKSGVKQGFFGEGLTKRDGLHESVRKLNRYIEKSVPKIWKYFLDQETFLRIHLIISVKSFPTIFSASSKDIKIRLRSFLSGKSFSNFLIFIG